MPGWRGVAARSVPTRVPPPPDEQPASEHTARRDCGHPCEGPTTTRTRHQNPQQELDPKPPSLCRRRRPGSGCIRKWRDHNNRTQAGGWESSPRGTPCRCAVRTAPSPTNPTRHTSNASPSDLARSTSYPISGHDSACPARSVAQREPWLRPAAGALPADAERAPRVSSGRPCASVPQRAVALRQCACSPR